MKGLLIIFVIAFATVAAGRGSDYPYDDCETITSHFMFVGGGVEVRRARTRVVTDYVSGSYTGAFDLTAGFTLHLFPDHRAMLATWADISPAVLAAEGRWELRAGAIRIAWTTWRLDAETNTSFVRSHGRCESLNLYLAFEQDRRVRQVLLVSTDKDGAKVDRPLFQRFRYLDWKRIADELGAKSG